MVTAGHPVAPRNERGGSTLFPRWQEGQADLTRLSVRFGLTGPDRYLDMGRTKPDPSKPKAGEFARDAYGRVILPPNPQIESVVEAAFNDRADFALFKIKPPYPAASFNVDSDADVHVGDKVYVYGSFEGNDPMFGEGLVSGVEGNLLEYRMPTTAGFSGGPVILARTGKVIAIHHGNQNVAQTDPNAKYPLEPIKIATKLVYTPVPKYAPNVTEAERCAWALKKLWNPPAP